MSIKNEMIQAMMHEISIRKAELGSEPIKSIYFGGGTPSFVQSHDIGLLLEQTFKSFNIDKNAEITLEANPEDINETKTRAWKSHGINRLSIGIQTFNNSYLEWMNRQHSGEDAIAGVKLCQDLGFSNINVDLIYGIPGMPFEEWKTHVKQILSLGVQHLSAYSLTVEPRTALHHQIKTGKTANVNEEQSYKEFMWLIGHLEGLGWEHYEISNFCKRGNMALHNTNYWKQKPYIGFGPAAHSYVQGVRSYNIQNNQLYVKALMENERKFESEILSNTNKINEWIMLGLRTRWGINMKDLSFRFGIDFYSLRKEEIQNYIGMGHLVLKDKTLKLSNTGKAFADKIASDLFLFEDEPKQFTLIGLD